MHPTLNIAVRAARSAGNVIIRNLDRLDSLAVHTKDRNDFVTEVDQQAEKEIISILRKAYPGHGILAEESGLTEGDDYQWIIDPLDGTTNFLHGFPQFAVSIALRHKGRLEQAVVYDPLRQELFTASRGAGAMLNDRRIRVTKRSLAGRCAAGHRVSVQGAAPPGCLPGYVPRPVPAYRRHPAPGFCRAGPGVCRGRSP